MLKRLRFKDREGAVAVAGIIIAIALLGLMACAEIIAMYRFILRWG